MENPTSDEKVLAALAHASVLFSFFGPIGATLIWVSQRNKSKYVRFHALQAMGYQVFAFWAWLLGIFVVVFGGVILISIAAGVLVGSDSSEVPFAPFIIQPIIFLGIFGLWGLFFMIGIIGAIFCMMNRDFTYPVIGQWLRKKFLASGNTDEESDQWEEYWVSGVCHSTVIMRLFGIITPIIIWYTQKERSARIQFQALQAIFYQLISIIASSLSFILGMGIYILFIGILIVGSAFTEPTAQSSAEASPIFMFIFLIIMAAFVVIWFVSIIVVPLYYLLGFIASLRAASGHDFNYPILGKIISRRLAQKDILAEVAS